MDRFVFWGLFVAFAGIIVGYVVWMRRTERTQERAGESGADNTAAGEGP
ncbi:MAG: hypothetical protein R3E10_03400 [Gemmatimonadota bacterium]